MARQIEVDEVGGGDGREVGGTRSGNMSPPPTGVVDGSGKKSQKSYFYEDYNMY